jgi:hypothetical protein
MRAAFTEARWPPAALYRVPAGMFHHPANFPARPGFAESASAQVSAMQTVRDMTSPVAASRSPAVAGMVKG